MTSLTARSALFGGLGIGFGVAIGVGVLVATLRAPGDELVGALVQPAVAPARVSTPDAPVLATPNPSAATQAAVDARVTALIATNVAEQTVVASPWLVASSLHLTRSDALTFGREYVRVYRDYVAYQDGVWRLLAIPFGRATPEDFACCTRHRDNFDAASVFARARVLPTYGEAELQGIRRQITDAWLELSRAYDKLLGYHAGTRPSDDVLGEARAYADSAHDHYRVFNSKATLLFQHFNITASELGL
jgi:hypothetical protein